MRIGAAFPSKYIKAEDLNHQRIRIKMARVILEDVGGEPKPVLYFYGTEKGMVLNKTNANEISEAYGDETDEWNGKEIELHEARVDFRKKTWAIRVNAFVNRQPVQQTAPSFGQAVAAQAPIQAQRPLMNGHAARPLPPIADDTPAALPSDNPFNDVDKIPF